MKLKLKLRITNTKDVITWELRGSGVEISRHWEYNFVVNAIKAAKQFAKKLNIAIVSCTYCEPEFNYEQPLRI